MSTQLEQHLESELRRMADPVTAEPTSTARAAVGLRTTTLRRRRRTHRALAGAVVAAAVVTGALWFRPDADAKDVETGPVDEAPSDEENLPAFTIDALGLEPSVASETTNGMSGETGFLVMQVQRFVGPRDSEATIELTVQTATDPLSPEPGWETVSVAGSEAYVREDSPVIELKWIPDGVRDMHAEVEASHVDRDELFRFVEGLKPVESGLEPTVLPDGFTDATDPDQVLHRQLDLSGTELAVAIIIQPQSAEGGCGSNPVDVSVLGHDADLVGDGTIWCLTWQHGSASVTIHINGHEARPVDRSVINELIGGIRELPEEEWQTFLEQYDL